MSFEQTMENIARFFEAVGVAVIVIGGLAALVSGSKEFRDLDPRNAKEEKESLKDLKFNMRRKQEDDP